MSEVDIILQVCAKTAFIPHDIPFLDFVEIAIMHVAVAVIRL